MKATSKTSAEIATGLDIRLPSPRLRTDVVVQAVKDVAMKYRGMKGETRIDARNQNVCCNGAIEFSPAAQTELIAIIDSFTMQARELLSQPDLPPFEIAFHDQNGVTVNSNLKKKK